MWFEAILPCCACCLTKHSAKYVLIQQPQDAWVHQRGAGQLCMAPPAVVLLEVQQTAMPKHTLMPCQGLAAAHPAARHA
jgi:hypothetical protein